MEIPNKPIKRSIELAPLSREHHDGLLFVWKIREGLKNETPVSLVSAYVHWYWQHHLAPHFMQEESLLLPLFPQEPLLLQMAEEHQQIEALLHLNESIGDKVLLEELAAALYDHIRFEERVLFPFVEKKLSPEKLSETGAQLHLPKEKRTQWEAEFWKRKK